jgi:LysR family hydrogen peroxide-inducible transcriptional activator
MNLQQLEYIIAVDRERHFVRAADSCFVTQATLSAMVKKLEEELGCTIFDRSKQPVVPTELGIKIVERARIIVGETRNMREMVKEASKEVSGEIRLGIIPTIAPYLLPLFLSEFLAKYPKVKLKIRELTTDTIIEQLLVDHLDFGILATPLLNESIRELPLYYEEFVLYAHPEEDILKTRLLTESNLDADKLWILEEGHCLRSQVINFCKISADKMSIPQLEFEAGSIETLVNLVNSNKGYTLLPELAVAHFTEDQMDSIRYFMEPQPVREVSLVSYRHYFKSSLQKALIEHILEHIPNKMKDSKNRFITPLVKV